MSKGYLWVLLFILLASIASVAQAAPLATASASGEDWKGAPAEAEFTFGGLAGLGLIDSTAGFALIGTAAKKLVHQGFAPDLDNQVFLELQLGPVFARGSTALFYSTHLRWDFTKDAAWTLYALAGLGGNVTGQELGDRWTAFPRVGLGAMMALSGNLSLRGEISHELTAAGVSFAL